MCVCKVDLRGLGSEQCPLHSPQVVSCGEHEGQQAEQDHPEHVVGLDEVVEREDERELSPEPDESGQSEGGHESDHHECGVDGHLAGESSEEGDLSGSDLVSGHTAHHEQDSGDESVCEHLEDGEHDSGLGSATDSEHDHSHVADGRECDHLLEIALGDTAVCTVDDREDGDGDDDPLPVVQSGGQSLDTDTDDTVGSHLKHDTCQQDGSSGGCLGVCIGQPCVEGNCGHLDCESEEQEREDEHLERIGHCRHHGVDGGEAEVDMSDDGSDLERHGEDSDQHHEGCHVGVDEELDSSVVPAGPSIPGDHEVHGYERELPHDVEQEVVRRQVDSHESDLHRQYECVEVVGPVLLLCGEDDDQQGQQGCQEHHQDAESIDHQREADSDA